METIIWLYTRDYNSETGLAGILQWENATKAEQAELDRDHRQRSFGLY